MINQSTPLQQHANSIASLTLSGSNAFVSTIVQLRTLLWHVAVGRLSFVHAVAGLSFRVNRLLARQRYLHHLWPLSADKPHGALHLADETTRERRLVRCTGNRRTALPWLYNRPDAG